MLCVAAHNISVSTDQQTTGLEAQVRALKDYCHLNKIEDFELFTDEGISGTKSSRPALDRMMAMVRTGEASCVVVYSFSRFARSTTNMLNGLETMKANNCNFVSLTEKIDTNSPIGKAVFVLTGESIPTEQLVPTADTELTFGVKIDHSYCGPGRLEVPDDRES